MEQTMLLRDHRSASMPPAAVRSDSPEPTPYRTALPPSLGDSFDAESSIRMPECSRKLNRRSPAVRSFDVVSFIRDPRQWSAVSSFDLDEIRSELVWRLPAPVCRH
jgi:hypothetical protein